MVPASLSSAQREAISWTEHGHHPEPEPDHKAAETETYDGELHDFEDPDGQRQVDEDQEHQQQDEEVKAALPPAVDSHLVDVRFVRTLDIAPMRTRLLGHLRRDRGGYGCRPHQHGDSFSCWCWSCSGREALQGCRRARSEPLPL